MLHGTADFGFQECQGTLPLVGRALGHDAGDLDKLQVFIAI